MPQTLLYDALESELPRASADRDHLWIPLDDLERATGWTARPEGLCRGGVCVPIPAAQRTDWLDERKRIAGGGDLDGERLDFAAFAAHLGHAVARDDDRGLWAFGPAALGGAALADQALQPGWSDIRLPDLDGALHSLSDYLGKKILLYGWASW